MPTPTNPALYGLFERVISLAPEATSYDIMPAYDSTQGDTTVSRRTITTVDKTCLPWGVIDGILSVEWLLGGKLGVRLPSGRMGDGRAVSISCSEFYGGIFVRSNLMEPRPIPSISCPTHSEIVGVAGVIRSLPNCVALSDEDAVVRRVLEIIRTAYEVMDLEYPLGDRHNNAGVDVDCATTAGPSSDLAAAERATGRWAT